MGATQRSKLNAGTKNHGKFLGFAVCLWNLLSATWSAKIFESEIWAKHGRHAALDAERGEPKVVGNSRDSRCIFGTFFVQLGPRKFWKRKLLRSMGATQRLRRDAGSQKFCKVRRIRGSSWDLCCCKVVFGTFFFEGRSAKILEPEISAKHGRHAAFAAQHGEPKVVGNSPDSRCISGTFSVQLGPRKFWRRKFLKSMGATQRFACDAGGEGEVVAIYRSGIRCVCGAWGAKTLSTEKKGQKTKLRESFALFFPIKTTPWGGGFFFNLLFAFLLASFSYNLHILQLQLTCDCTETPSVQQHHNSEGEAASAVPRYAPQAMRLVFGWLRGFCFFPDVATQSQVSPPPSWFPNFEPQKSGGSILTFSVCAAVRFVRSRVQHVRCAKQRKTGTNAWRLSLTRIEKAAFSSTVASE